MTDEPIVLSENDVRTLRQLVQDHTEGYGMTILEDMAEVFDCEWVLKEEKNIDNPIGIVKSLVNDINNSERIEEFIEYLSNEFRSGRKLFYELLENYQKEPGYQLELQTEMKSVIEDGKPVEHFFLTPSAFEIIKSFILNSGKAFEKTPETFSKFDEESLRDIILVVLNSIFKGAATGETFSGSGKTDIHISFSGNDSLIIECKIWHGQKTLEEALSQLFDYNTLNESFGVILMFSINMNFDEIIEKSKQYITAHSSFVKNSLTSLAKNILISTHKHPQGDSRQFQVYTIFFNLYHKRADKSLKQTSKKELEKKHEI